LSAAPGSEFAWSASASARQSRIACAALKSYEAKRRPATSDVVLANRKAPPDAILHEVYRRTGDKPFKNIDDVISREELIALSESYKRVAGYDKAKLKAKV